VAAAVFGWLLTVVTTDTQYDIIALLVGFLVGGAVVLGSGAAYSRRLQVVSVGVTLLGLTASQYLIGRHFLAKFVAEEGGGSMPVLLDLDDAITLVRDSLAANLRILVFWALALWAAWRIPAPRKRAGQALRLPAATSRPWQAVALAAGTIVLLGLGVSVAVMGTADDRSRAGLRMVIDDLQVGHCYEPATQNAVGMVDVVPCNQPHVGEVFAIVRLREPKLPAEAELERLSDRVCAARFPQYVGVALRDSKLNFGWWTPTKESWADGDRTLVCVLEDPNRHRLIGSMRGTHR
jgi:hypothetical protein